jgi:hypothetical protein
MDELYYVTGCICIWTLVVVGFIFILNGLFNAS